jgi:hypothetical protein
MAVQATKTLSSGNPVIFYVKVEDSEAIVRVNYVRPPTQFDRAEVERILAEVMSAAAFEEADGSEGPVDVPGWRDPI